MWKQLQLHEQSKTIFLGSNMCVQEKCWYQQITWKIFLGKVIKFQVSTISLSKVMTFFIWVTYKSIYNFLRTKKTLQKMNSFLSWAPTHHSFTFNLQCLYQLKQKVHLSKTVWQIFHFQFCLLPSTRRQTL